LSHFVAPPAFFRRLTLPPPPNAKTADRQKTKKPNNSITCAPCDWLDGKHVAFGRVLEDHPPNGLFLLRKIEHVATGPQNRPRIPVLIAECGEM
jgi:peptidyl-prolyl isomerase H (cyclophilin H)